PPLSARVLRHFPKNKKAGRARLFREAEFGQLLTASFRPLPAENFGTLRAGIFTSAPVCGLRPVVASRLETEKFPKPIRRTSPPLFSWLVMTEKTASTAAWASALESLAASATADTSSFLFMENSLPCERPVTDSTGRMQTLENELEDTKRESVRRAAFYRISAVSSKKAGSKTRLPCH